MTESRSAHTKRVAEWWDDRAADYHAKHRSPDVIRHLVDRPISAFHPDVWSLLSKHVPDVRGRKVLVPASGDNLAVYALHLLGAQVTSIDLSQRQLEGAAEIATRNGWSIAFICDDIMRLAEIESATYDLVYTSNGVHVWVSDVVAMYSSIYRVLRPAGRYLMYDIHPFTRPFRYIDGEQPRIIKPYAEVAPHCHWRIQDLLNAMIQAGFRLIDLGELNPEDGNYWDASLDQPVSETETLRLNDWKSNPMAALPQFLTVCLEKPSA